jgi:hypothetical protein
MNTGAMNLLGTHRHVLLSRVASGGVHRGYWSYPSVRTFSLDGPGGGAGHFEKENKEVMPKALDNYLKRYKNKPPRIVCTKTKSWFKQHSGKFCTHATMRSKRFSVEPWVCETFVNDKVSGIMHKTRALIKSKLDSVDELVTKTYTNLLKNNRCKRSAPYGH